jgi:hypothetical protein
MAALAITILIANSCTRWRGIFNGIGYINMELDLQSLFGLLRAAVLIGLDPTTPPLPPYLGSHTRALLVSQDRRHLFVTPCVKGSHRMGDGRNLLKISAPLPLIRTFRMSPLLARSISLDSTCKRQRPCLIRKHADDIKKAWPSLLILVTRIAAYCK